MARAVSPERPPHILTATRARLRVYLFGACKMSKWCGTETGILRKKCAPERLEELLVFGYACKLFRDDEKALYVDQGKHLIPWMADEKLKIDRYDCRGALSDLTPYEAGREGYDAMRWLGLSESERKIEQLCDEERYHSLNTNEEEEEMYKEEEIKRLQQKTNEFSYSYDVPQDPDAVQAPDPPTVEEEEREYIPPPELHVPADIAIPKNVKENARVEKTAHFVSKQGPQMEILIKAKQADNPQFSFLNQCDPLYKYYKHVLSAIKGGSYRVDSAPKEEQPKKDENERDAGEGSYLHPSLQASPVHQPPPPATPLVPLVSYKPTADCAYSQLVNRIQGTHGDGAASSGSKHEAATQAPPNQVTYEQQQQYYQYYYAMQYYEYYKQMAAQFHSLGDSDGQNIPPHVQEQINAQAMAFAQMAYTQYVQQNSTNAATAAATTTTSNPYAQIVSNLSQSKDNNVYPSTYQPVQDHAGDITKAPVLYGSDGVEQAPADVPAPAPPAASVKDEPPEKAAKPRAEIAAPKKALLSLIHYGSDTEESGDDAAAAPPDDVRVIIDKMASYVSKNGADFESIVRAKGDARFNFLEEAHEHHAYYRRKLAEFITPGGPPLKDGEKARTPEKNGVHKAKEKKIITPVSFSIKKSKEEIPKDIRNALPVEESDEEEAGEDSSNSTVEAPPPVTTTATTTTTTPSEPSADLLLPERSPPEDKTATATATKEETDASVDDPVLDMIDLTDDLEERKDAKRAEDKIKDKLAAAAREKLASAGKDRALQMERKKKAAAFLKLKSAEGGGTAENNRGEDKILVISDTDERVRCSRSKSRTRDKNPKKKKKGTSDLEEGEIIKKQHRKSGGGGKKKRSHKRKHSKSRHESSRSHQHKKTRKRRRRSDSHNSGESSSAS